MAVQSEGWGSGQGGEKKKNVSEGNARKCGGGSPGRNVNKICGNKFFSVQVLLENSGEGSPAQALSGRQRQVKCKS
jgi:hypothetical protein